MRKIIFFASALLLLVIGDAQAERVGLLMLTPPQQWLDIDYKFLGQQQSTTTEQHQLAEDYNYKFQYAVIRPSLLRGSIALKLELDQRQSGTSSQSTGILTGEGFFYHINGVLLERSVAPASFALDSTITEVAQPFANSYQQTTTAYNLQWSLRNDILPTTIRYSKGNSETSGLVVDSKSDTDQVSISTQHTLGISRSSLEIYDIINRYVPTQGASRTDKRYELRFNNDLQWTKAGKNRMLSTRLTASEATGINYIRNLDLNENLLWDWGKALRSGATYSFFNSGGDGGSQVHNAADVWLQHLLFKSLTTRIDLNARKDEYPTGYEQEVKGRYSFGYVKELPKEGRLTLNGYQQLGAIKRQLGNTDHLHILNESHTVVFGGHIYLGQPNVIESSITVRNADSLKRLPPYDLNTDYQVVVTGTQAEIVPVSTGAIKEGDTLLISYDYKVDSRVDSTTAAYGVDGALMLFKGAFQLYGNVSQSREDRVSSQASLAGLTAQGMSRVGAEVKWGAITLTSEYETLDSDSDKHQEARAMARYNSYLRDGTLTLSLRDNYRWYEAIGTTRRADENTFSVSAGYNAVLFSTTAMTLNVDYENIGGARQSDRLTIGNSLRWSAGKLALSLLSGFGARREAGRISYDEHIHLILSRYF
ncbi:hypothetical protein F6V30_02510 [Oryzomonas sagensis]|uniref:TIGR03016 family PEP-CTERM system-associated outer membrane protein n=1 Tax=Oryzomonas sagensis TaxID=2603857 RepID=A0ABQ6TR12_9BACT|nr:hypothetical protein [Oryzomonas sagensis]KAB0671471.1 hypothetical protein F6V30_02510 [Oryzomonas sagensis]